ncbi:hypothetical protein BDY24DRAFT_55767 [Mrakia frigida]|uniref:uncharacterized protein n=1 Tax=Mrakia frigida TaxID=29902 RepID=UPI003FCBF14F
MGNLLSSGAISPTIPPSSDGEILEHATFSSPAPSSSSNVRYPLSAFAEFHLPLSAKDLFFISRGSTSAGEVYIQDEDEAGGGGGGGEKKSAGGVVAEVKVVVEVRFRDVDDLEYMTVVKLRRPGGGEGVGIYTPNRPFIPRPPLVFYTTLHLPSSAPASLLASLSLETISSNTLHSVSLPSTSSSPILSLSLLTSNQPITFTSPLQTLSSLSAKTSNAQVHTQGEITSPSIQIITSNKPVRAEKTWRADRVKVVTSNAAIEILEEEEEEGRPRWSVRTEGLC